MNDLEIDFINHLKKDFDLSLCVAALYSFADADYDGIEPIRVSAIADSDFFTNFEITKKQIAFNLLMTKKYICNDNNKIGWIRLTDIGLNYFNEIKNYYYEDDFLEDLQLIISEIKEKNEKIKFEPALSAYPNTICTKAGSWFCPNDGLREITMKVGEKFPAADRGLIGGIIWYWKSV